MDFSKRLLNILIARDISNSYLSKQTGIATARISNFCNGKDLPRLHNAIILVNFLNCSFDYLLGLSDDSSEVLFKREYSFEKFYKRLKVLLSANRLSQVQLCADIGICKSCISNWRLGQEPKTRNLIKIAQKLNCSVDYLLGY